MASNRMVTVREAAEMLDKDDYWRRFQVDYPEDRQGLFLIQKFEIEQHASARLKNILDEGMDRDTGYGEFRRLVEIKADENELVDVKIHPDGMVEPDHVLWMSDTRAEIMEHSPFFNKLMFSEFVKHKRLLVNGLGLGVVAHGALTYEGISHIDIVEKNHDIIELISKYLPEDKVTIHEADAYDITWPPGTRWDYAWHDIRPTIDDDNLPGMDQLRQKYKRRVAWQDCWQRKGCLKMQRIMKQVEDGTLDPNVALEILGGKFHL